MTAPPVPQLPAEKPPVERGVFRFAKQVPLPSGSYAWVYLWGLPLRVMHWVAALCIVGLVVTGLYIGRPYFMTSGEASSHYLMGWFRFSHFTMAAVLVTTAMIRIYWLFMGNRFERFPALFPVRPRDWRNMWKIIRFYLLVDVHHEPKYLGHNPLQQVSYTLTYVFTFVAIVTGFAMYGQSNPGGVIYTMFDWVNTAIGGSPITRFIHHATSWYFVSFAVIHAYLSIRSDHWDRSGTVSSVISGGRFVPTNEIYEDGQP